MLLASSFGWCRLWYDLLHDIHEVVYHDACFTPGRVAVGEEVGGLVQGNHAVASGHLYVAVRPMNGVTIGEFYRLLTLGDWPPGGKDERHHHVCPGHGCAGLE